MRSKFLASQKAPMICNDAPSVTPRASTLRGTPMITLDKVRGVYVRRTHGVYAGTLTATIADRVASK